MKIILTILSVFTFSYFGVAQTSLTGKVIEEETGDPVIYGSVALYKNDVLIMGIETDFDGVYSFTNVDPGTYDLEVSYVGFGTKRIANVVVMADRGNMANVNMNHQIGCELIITNCPIPMIRQDDFTQGRVFLSEDIRRSPVSSNN